MLSCYSVYPSKNFFNGEFKIGFISIQNCGDLGFEMTNDLIWVDFSHIKYIYYGIWQI